METQNEKNTRLLIKYCWRIPVAIGPVALLMPVTDLCRSYQSLYFLLIPCLVGWAVIGCAYIGLFVLEVLGKAESIIPLEYLGSKMLAMSTRTFFCGFVLVYTARAIRLIGEYLHSIQ